MTAMLTIVIALLPLVGPRSCAPIIRCGADAGAREGPRRQGTGGAGRAARQRGEGSTGGIDGEGRETDVLTLIYIYRTNHMHIDSMPNPRSTIALFSPYSMSPELCLFVRLLCQIPATSAESRVTRR